MKGKKKQEHVFVEDGFHPWTCKHCGEEFKIKFECEEHEKVCESNPKKEIKVSTENVVPENKEIVSQKNNKKAVVGFILSLLSIFGIGLAGIIGMILGIVALTQIKYTNEKGKGLAVAAMIIGFIWGLGVGILRRLVEAGF